MKGQFTFDERKLIESFPAIVAIILALALYGWALALILFIYSIELEAQ